ncbi:MAG: Ig-like domain-containing protein, partial [Candidatus Geothermarchaeales archaeon]
QGAAVNFYISTTFGWLKIGSATTDQEGVATLSHTQKEAGTIQIKAVYEGDKNFEASDSSINLEIMERGTVSSRPAGLIGILSSLALPAVVAIIALIVGSVFGLFGYVLYQLYRISRGESSGSRIPWARSSKFKRDSGERA